MKKHNIGDSLLIHSIMPIPDGWVDRTGVNVGNKYNNEAVWNLYKDSEHRLLNDGFYLNSYSTNVDNSYFFNSDIVNVLNINVETGYTWTYSQSVITSDGKLVVMVHRYDLTNYLVYFRIYKSNNPVVDEYTDYPWAYANLNLNHPLSDFTYIEDIFTCSSSSTSRLNETLRYGIIRKDGRITYGDYNISVNYWYADDRNETNQAFLDQKFISIYNPETHTIDFQGKGSHILAPRSLVKTPSSDPWAAQNNYAFDINNIDYIRIYPMKTVSGNFDYEDNCFYLNIQQQTKQFYTVGSPAVPAFNYINMYYRISLETQIPIVVSYANGGTVNAINNGYSTSSSPGGDAVIFNNICYRCSTSLSGGNSSVSGVEIVYGTIDFKADGQLDDYYQYYTGFTVLPYIYYYFNDTNEVSYISSTSPASQFFHAKRINHARKQEYNNIAIPVRYAEGLRPFSLTKTGGFQFIGDTSFGEYMVNNMTGYVSNGAYGVLYAGYELLHCGEEIVNFLKLYIDQGYAFPSITNYDYNYIKLASGKINGNTLISFTGHTSHTITFYNNFIEQNKTNDFVSNLSTTDGFISPVFLVSDDLTSTFNVYGVYRRDGYTSTEFVGYNHGSNRFLMNLYMTDRNLTSPCSYAIPIDLQKDTYTMPIINAENEDYKYITKITPSDE